jgi:hypothetical protein
MSKTYLTDEEIQANLKPFIGNVEARSKTLLPKLDLRFLHDTTKRIIGRHKELKNIDINVLINNTLIFALVNDYVRFPENINDNIIKGVLENKSFLGIKVK